MVFPYMDHDLAGLLDNPKVKLKQPQIKTYLKQLLEGTAYLHHVKYYYAQYLLDTFFYSTFSIFYI
jgi:serine/threonine protein kinase